jgi:dTDP-4-dehydrorhamnose 3,5-epimerase-like enzyme
MSTNDQTMNNMEYTKKVDQGIFPANNLVPIDTGFVDARGEIKNLLLTPITSVAEIRSVRGAIRANHYHLTDWHYTFVVSGQVLYFERDVGSTEVPKHQTINPGQMFFTPPMREHAMLFSQDSVIMTFAKNIRSHENHEGDLVRVTVVSADLAKRLVP